MCSRVRNASTEVKQKILALFESMFFISISSCFSVFIYVNCKTSFCIGKLCYLVIIILVCFSWSYSSLGQAFKKLTFRISRAGFYWLYALLMNVISIDK